MEKRKENIAIDTQLQQHKSSFIIFLSSDENVEKINFLSFPQEFPFIKIVFVSWPQNLVESEKWFTADMQSHDSHKTAAINDERFWLEMIKRQLNEPKKGFEWKVLLLLMRNELTEFMMFCSSSFVLCLREQWMVAAREIEASWGVIWSPFHGHFVSSCESVLAAESSLWSLIVCVVIAHEFALNLITRN